MDGKLALVQPWTEYYRKLDALFGGDPNVDVIYDQDVPEVRLLVRGESKADAISKLLPTEVEFGNVRLGVKVVPANLSDSREDLLRAAFDGNPSLVDIQTYDLMTNKITFVVFEKEVVQYYNDNIGDVHGLRSTLMQEIAKEVIGEDGGVHFCTDNGM